MAFQGRYRKHLLLIRPSSKMQSMGFAPLLVLVNLLLITTAIPSVAQAQEAPSNVAEFSGFKIVLPRGNGWSYARPVGVFRGLIGYLNDATPPWFPVSSSEIPVPILRGMRRGEFIGIDQLSFAKKLGKGSQRAATIVQASWSTIPVTASQNALKALATAREQDLRSRFKQVQEFKAQVWGDDILSGCLRTDARLLSAWRAGAISS